MNRCEGRCGVTAARIRTGSRRHAVLEELAAAGASCSFAIRRAGEHPERCQSHLTGMYTPS